MSRYIDAEWLSECFPDAGEGNLTYNRTALGYIDSAPSIDIVCCGECSKRKKNKFCLEHMRYEKDDYGYCSYGEREGE